MASENIFNKDDIILINDIIYKIIKLIGHGKGGYSYLATDGKTKVDLSSLLSLLEPKRITTRKKACKLLYSNKK